MDLTRCSHCGSRECVFVYWPSGDGLCAECTSAFVSWMLDGGMAEDPQMFEHIANDDPELYGHLVEAVTSAPR